MMSIPIITYESSLKLYKIWVPSGIKEDHIIRAKYRGWHLYVDGHGQYNGLLDAPKSDYEDVIEFFTLSS